MEVAPRRRAAPLPWLKPSLLVGGLSPLLSMGYRAFKGELGANPISSALNQLGLLALIFLIGGLALTPLKLVFGWTWPVRIRRWVGVMAFGYACLHLLTYAVLDQQLALGAIANDILKRKFIFVGFAAWLLLVPLAVTSTDAMVKRLKFKRWQRIHTLAYLTAPLGVVHFYLRVKKDVTEPLVYGALLALLLGVRVIDKARKRAAKGAQAA